MLLIAIGGREASARIRSHAETIRMASGVVIALVALRARLPRRRPPREDLGAGWTTYLQDKVEGSSSGKRELAKVRGGGAALAVVHKTPGNLPDYGVAPPIHADGDWINTKPLTLAQLRGKVVLIDFWTYSCINCLRTLPHLKAWYATYRKQGLVIIGVHTPEFAFEHVDVERARSGEAARHHVPGRAGQPLQDVGQLREPVLARRVPDRQDRATCGTRTSAKASTARPSS